jgi:hypothetical protein
MLVLVVVNNIVQVFIPILMISSIVFFAVAGVTILMIAFGNRIMYTFTYSCLFRMGDRGKCAIDDSHV